MLLELKKKLIYSSSSLLDKKVLGETKQYIYIIVLIYQTTRGGIVDLGKNENSCSSDKIFGDTESMWGGTILHWSMRVAWLCQDM